MGETYQVFGLGGDPRPFGLVEFVFGEFVGGNQLFVCLGEVGGWVGGWVG